MEGRVRFALPGLEPSPCLDPDADTEMLAELEIGIGNRLRAPAGDHTRPVMARLEDPFPMACRLPRRKAYLADSF